MKKRAFAFVIALAFVFALCGCGSAVASKTTSVIKLASARSSDFTLSVSSTLNDPSLDVKSEYLTDGDIKTLWYSQWADEKNPECNEWILLDFGSVKKVESITLTPNESHICFPSDFTIGWGVTGDVFPAIENGAYTNYALSSESGETFTVNTVTRFIRIYVTRRTANKDGNYLVSLSEVSASSRSATAVEIENAVRADSEIVRRPVEDDPVIPSAATASSSLDEVEGTSGWAVANINDGSVATQWCAEWGSGITDENCEEWIVLTFAAPQYVRGVTIRSQQSEHYGFPKAFDFQWTLDGENFFSVKGASYTDEPTDNTLHIKVFDTPVTATAIRMNITASYSDTVGNYIPQLAELQAHGRTATESEITAATAEFNKLAGALQPAAARVKGMGAISAAGGVMLAFSVVLFGVAAGLLIVLLAGRKNTRAAIKDAQNANAGVTCETAVSENAEEEKGELK